MRKKEEKGKKTIGKATNITFSSGMDFLSEIKGREILHIDNQAKKNCMLYI